LYNNAKLKAWITQQKRLREQAKIMAMYKVDKKDVSSATSAKPLVGQFHGLSSKSLVDPQHISTEEKDGSKPRTLSKEAVLKGNRKSLVLEIYVSSVAHNSSLQYTPMFYNCSLPLLRT
jgi:hypothetical protein